MFDYVLELTRPIQKKKIAVGASLGRGFSLVSSESIVRKIYHHSLCDIYYLQI